MKRRTTRVFRRLGAPTAGAVRRGAWARGGSLASRQLRKLPSPAREIHLGN